MSPLPKEYPRGTQSEKRGKAHKNNYRLNNKTGEKIVSQKKKKSELEKEGEPVLRGELSVFSFPLGKRYVFPLFHVEKKARRPLTAGEGERSWGGGESPLKVPLHTFSRDQGGARGFPERRKTIIATLREEHDQGTGSLFVFEDPHTREHTWGRASGGVLKEV